MLDSMAQFIIAIFKITRKLIAILLEIVYSNLTLFYFIASECLVMFNSSSVE